MSAGCGFCQSIYIATHDRDAPPGESAVVKQQLVQDRYVAAVMQGE